MKKNFLLVVLAFALSLPALQAFAQQTPSSGAKKTDVTQLAFLQDKDKDDQKKPMRADKDQPEEIRRAMQALKSARNDLEHAGNEWGGHRANAVEHIDAAIKELNEAMEFARSKKK
jgi:glucose dehydrogenase